MPTALDVTKASQRGWGRLSGPQPRETSYGGQGFPATNAAMPIAARVASRAFIRPLMPHLPSLFPFSRLRGPEPETDTEPCPTFVVKLLAS